MKVAIVGTGVSGLGSAWLLNEYSEHTVHMFESDHRFGGHANTVDYVKPGAKEGTESTRVDTGFIVFNTVTYPNFLRFLETKKLPYIASEMSFSVSRDRGLYEWAGTGLSALFAQRKNLFNPSQFRMIWDILRFNANAIPELRKGDRNESIGDLLKRGGYSESFKDDYLLPMTAAIWSTPPDKAGLDFPAFTLLRFMHNHHLLQILDRPVWLTLKDGSHQYVNSILQKLDQNNLHLNTKIQSVSTSENSKKVTLKDDAGVEWEFDHVIFATHADTTLSILEAGNGITKQERSVLGGFEFGPNRAVLHGDPELMPKIRETWSAWNYLTASDGEKANVNSVALTYYMNTLQSIDEEKHGPVLVTLNPPFEPKKELIRGEWSYDHPLYSERSVASQALLPTIQNKRNITFSGAWSAYGFHEDGFSSGLRVATNYLDVIPPFEIKHAEREIPYILQDNILELTLAGFELIRKILEGPWTALMILLLGVIGFMQVIAELAGTFKVEGANEFAGLLSDVKGFWKKSAGGKSGRVEKLLTKEL